MSEGAKKVIEYYASLPGCTILDQRVQLGRPHALLRLTDGVTTLYFMVSDQGAVRCSEDYAHRIILSR